MLTSPPSQNDQVAAVQAELLAMLGTTTAVESGRNGSVVPSAKTEVVTTSSCPRCGYHGWNQATWCPDCGYFPKAGYEGTDPATATEDEDAPLDLRKLVPVWGWILLGGVAFEVGSSIWFSLVIGEHFARSLVSVAVLLFSLMLMLVSHTRAYFRTLSRSDSLGVLDIVLRPMGIWGRAFKELPESSHLVCSMAWGIVGVAMSVGVIGGLEYEAVQAAVNREERSKGLTAADLARVVVRGAAAMPQRSGEGDPQDMLGDLNCVSEEASGSGGGAKGLDQVIGQFAGNGSAIIGGGSCPNPTDSASGDRSGVCPPGGDGEPGMAGTTRPADTEDSAQQTVGTVASVAENHQRRGTEGLDPGQVVTCLIVGYTVNPAGEPKSLLLAAPIGRNWRYVSRLQVEAIPAGDLAELQRLFPSHAARSPIVACPFGGRWLTPTLFCQVHFPYSTSNLRFDAPTWIELGQPGAGIGR